MRRRRSPLLRPAQGRYLESLQPPRDALSRALEERAEREGQRLAAPEVARFVESMAAREPAGRMLELGCGIGYLTLRLLRAAPQSHVVAVDAAEAVAATAETLAAVGLLGRVELLTGEPIEHLTGLAGPFDLVVLDAGRGGEPRRSLDLALPLLRVGGSIVVTGLLGGGEVADPALRREDSSRAAILERFNPYFLIHPQLAASLLPIGDGVGLATKRRPTIRELGGPY